MNTRMVAGLRDPASLVAGAVLLYFGGAWLVRGAAGIAVKLKVKPLIVGLTIVAYGTSAPELFVGIRAALAGRGGIAFGNAVGSNIANLGLILGVTALIAPPKVDASLLRRELPAMVMSSLAVPLLLVDGGIGRGEGAGLLFFACLYTVLAIRGGRAEPASASEMSADARAATIVAREVPSPAVETTPRLCFFITCGLGLLVVGGELLVDGASGVARAGGVSERVVGLTIVAVGTSLPELATSLIAARRGHSDIAVGNVVGSNIFNVLLILGASGVAGPLSVSLHEARVELVGLVGATLAGAFFLRGDRRISRAEGAVLLLIYLLTLMALAGPDLGRRMATS